MKTLIIIMALMLFGTARAQDSTLVTDSKYEKLADKYIGQFSGALESLAETLEQPVTQVYGIYRRQVLIEGVITLLLMLFIIMVLFITTTKFIKAARTNRETDEAGMFIAGTVVFGALSLGMFLYLVGHNAYLTHIINPDYYVIQKLIDIVK